MIGLRFARRRVVFRFAAFRGFPVFFMGACYARVRAGSIVT
jgi:hypothetical protein